MKGRKTKYDFNSLNVGEQLMVNETQLKMSAAVCMFVKRKAPEKKFKTEKMSEGVRVTRIK
jgi:hypothetical protein